MNPDLNQTDTEALLNLLLEEEGYSSSGSPSIPSVDLTTPLPLSFAQQRLWLLSQLEGSSEAGNISGAVRLSGSLNVTALEQAIIEIVQRHTILRTSFSISPGHTVQIIGDAPSSLLKILDWQDVSEAQQLTAIQQFAIEEAQYRFDLTQAPLLRATLVILSQQQYVLLVTMHHIVSDGWSIGIFVRELSALYQAFCNGRTSPLPPLPIQYADFACWEQRQYPDSEMTETAIAYWIRQLGGSFPVLKLPTDRPRLPVQNHEGMRQSLVLSQQMTTALKTLSRQEEGTLFMTMLAAFQTLLHYYTGQEQIIVGTPIVGRNRTEIEELIGCFVNTLPLYSDFSGNPCFLQLLDRVRKMTIGAYAHQDLPIEKLLQELAPQRTLNQDPLFRVWFAFQNFPMSALKLPGLTVKLLPMESTAVQFDLECFLLEGAGSLNIWLNYRRDLFESTTISRLLMLFETLLLAIIEQPETHIDTLMQNLSQAEKHHELNKVKEFEAIDLKSLQNIKRRIRVNKPYLSDG